jgi:hypothetical protein
VRDGIINQFAILKKHFVAKVDRALSTLHLCTNSLIGKVQRCRAKFAASVFEDCRKVLAQEMAPSPSIDFRNFEQRRDTQRVQRAVVR